MISKMNAHSFDDDYNFLGKRNIRNTEKSSYNCGGYALESFSWYLPRHNNMPTHRTDGVTLESCIEAMLEDFPNLRVIQSLNELKDNEYAIAFRMSDYDFHYVKRASNGHWYHKMGSNYYIRTMTQKVVFSKSWGYGYDGEIVLMAKTR